MCPHLIGYLDTEEHSTPSDKRHQVDVLGAGQFCEEIVSGYKALRVYKKKKVRM